ncbi:glycosyltransferase family 2 protein [Plectonema cf. radiosum LEGE 06105]|uniref:Glycosyltransferase family 2 protein n=1 Tax=Plectonema cf. radiosum LEGE 06105 TaxID=945769 RepID=A0A8J7F5C1_9CYAN|nr:glycosyltransferase family 2 protein [Plectonema radiosum]MBE9215520.1 glycosyltransferase family 2 protein [Plectonema cf. radiosum LEGE 06105]
MSYVSHPHRLIKNRYKVLAYITAYEEPEAVKNCIRAIWNQTHKLTQVLVVDNSSKNILFVNENDTDSNIKILYHHDNIGISGGLAIAFEFAIKHDYNFLWTFDQDSIPQPNCLETLLNTYEESLNKNYSIGIIAPVSIDIRTNKVIEGAIFVKDHFTGCKHNNNDYPYECDAPITSGSLIPIATAKKNPLPRIDLFIDGIDMDYGLRLKQNGYHNFIVPQAILEHKFGNPVKVKFFHKERFFQQYSALRHYYICRNHTYLTTRYAKGWYRVTSCLRRIKYLIHTIILILFHESEQRSLKIWASIKGTVDGFQGKLGKNWY